MGFRTSGAFREPLGAKTVTKEIQRQRRIASWGKEPLINGWQILQSARTSGMAY